MAESRYYLDMELYGVLRREYYTEEERDKIYEEFKSFFDKYDVKNSEGKLSKSVRLEFENTIDKKYKRDFEIVTEIL